MLWDKFNVIVNISYTEYDPSGNSNFSFHVGADILNLLFLLRFDKVT